MWERVTVLYFQYVFGVPFSMKTNKASVAAARGKGKGVRGTGQGARGKEHVGKVMYNLSYLSYLALRVMVMYSLHHVERSPTDPSPSNCQDVELISEILVRPITGRFGQQLANASAVIFHQAPFL